MTPGKNLKDWLFSTLSNQSQFTHYSPTIRASIKAWRSIHDFTWNNVRTKLVQTPLTVLPFLSPNLDIPKWISDKFTHLESLRTLILAKPFSHMQKEYAAPANDFFIFFRIQQCLPTYPSLDRRLPIKLWNFLFTNNTHSKGISLVYSTLQEKMSFNKSKPIKDWENDLKTQYTDLQWQTAIKSIYKTTNCTALWEIVHKTRMRWYLTPQRITQFYPLISPDCWRNCSIIGTLMHIMWSCPPIRNLWSEIEHKLQQILQYPIILTPELSILNLTIESVPPQLRLITTHVLLATKLLITRNWKTTNIPASSDVIELVHKHYTYESVLARGKPSYYKMHALWLPWAQWYENIKSNVSQ